MAGKDAAIKSAIEECLQGSIGQNLKAYFEALPDKEIRRAITVLYNTYPYKTALSDEELTFVTYMLSTEKMIAQQSSPSFITSIGVIDFTESQKKILIPVIKNHIESLCEAYGFELDHLLMKLFTPQELLEYMSSLINSSSAAVLEHILDILRYEDFSKSYNDTVLEELNSEASERLRQIKRL